VILLDTHTLIWLQAGSERMGNRARKLIDRGLAEDELAVSSISFWEISMLALKNRLALAVPPDQLRSELLDNGLVEVPLNGEIAIAAANIQNFHQDPADRFILATATAAAATLVTADSRILEWKGRLKRQDARL
jgi:PIN domain nuclease of toxin-antitoxin system